MPLRIRHSFYSLTFLLLCVIFNSCKTNKTVDPLFTVLDAKTTGLDFANVLKPTAQFNMFTYMYYYNGAGIGAGDFNNDGLIDLFFSSNQGDNKLYINSGHLNFKDVTQQAKIPQDSGWSTGVSVVDINNDGLLDIYVCKVGHYEVLQSKNQLLICQGIDKSGVPFYKDEAANYGLNFSGFSTQAAFFDYDMDGDLDMFLLNHSVHHSGNYAPRKNFLGTYDELSGDKIYENTGNNKFVDITKLSGINSSAISYGLGMAVSDIDLDGWPDMYIGNDFHENDYLYINQHDGTFKDDLSNQIMHTSKFSMGVDIADINNDAYPEIISMDMLPSDPYQLRRSLDENDYEIFNMKLNYGYNYQYSRNNLQLNRGNGKFSEIGLYAGISATDWSWSPLWMDFDNDGLKDLFISNGIPKRMNDIDYVNYISNGEIQEKIRTNSMGSKDMSLLNKFPEIKLPNKFFRQKSNVQFDDVGSEISGNTTTFSNGAVYADFDNDGDLDVIVSNISETVTFYENNSNDHQNRPSLQVNLAGSEKNIDAIGAKLIVYDSNQIRTYEKYPVHGFQSSMQTPFQVGLYKSTIDSIILIWPDNTYQKLDYKNTTNLTVKYKDGLPVFNYHQLTKPIVNSIRQMVNITDQVKLNFNHKENQFNEFDREPLMPFMVSKEGPALAVGDANGDGLDDVFIGSSKREKSAVFFQTAEGIFIKSVQPQLDNDSTYEDVDAVWADVNNDGHNDLIVAGGGNEYFGNNIYQKPRLYLNDGKGNLFSASNAFNNIYLTGSCVAANDVDGDGNVDLFVGARAVPFEYGNIPRSYLLKNDGKGNFTDVTSTVCKELEYVGLVKNATWIDINQDGKKDLVITPEWGAITAFINENGQFKKKVINTSKGWWNFVLPVDINNDSKIDFIAGNEGLNSRLTASIEEPVKLYFNDFDNNGIKEQLLTYYLNHSEYSFADQDELQRQLPFIKRNYLYAEDFAKASLSQVFSEEKLKTSKVLSADNFASSLLLNTGNDDFSLKALPWLAQLSVYRDGIVINANNDALPDILLVGNFYDNNIKMGRNDADYGTILLNKGNGNFQCENLNGLQLTGQVRHIKKITIGNQEAMILARNNDSVMVIKFADDKPINK